MEKEKVALILLKSDYGFNFNSLIEDPFNGSELVFLSLLTFKFMREIPIEDALERYHHILSHQIYINDMKDEHFNKYIKNFNRILTDIKENGLDIAEENYINNNYKEIIEFYEKYR